MNITVTEVPGEICWAKTLSNGSPGISVRDHCLNVGCVAEALLGLLPEQLCELLPKSPAILAALHDIGKMSPGFQVKCQDWLNCHRLSELALKECWQLRESDHAKISQSTTQKRLNQSKLNPWAAIIGAHHGKIKGERVSLSEPWETERLQLLDELTKEFGPLPDDNPDDATLWFLAGLITVADWIGSDENRFLQNARWSITERRERAVSALQENGLTRTSVIKDLAFKDLFPLTPQANNLQDIVTEAIQKPGVYIIEAPMGYGKTEAALKAVYQLVEAEQATGLYFALPTQVTSNRIYLRLQPFIDLICSNSGDVRLCHGASWLFDAKPPLRLRAASADAEAQTYIQDGRSWFASSKRALLAPFGVGTIDQALLGVVASKHFFVRQFGLAGKVVILDEIHTYDLYTSTLVDELVKRLRELECTVIILSATLTKQRRRELLQLDDKQPLSTAYPLISSRNGQLSEWPCDSLTDRTINIRCVSGNGLVEEALEKAHRGACVLWIRNTVDNAQESYRALKNASVEGGPPIALLHSRFPFFRREELENEWIDRLGKDSLQRPSGCVLVSTQVAEQSVDIDADMLISDLAPTDMLLQRIGRLWRHKRANRPCTTPDVWIQIPSLDDKALRSANKDELYEALGKSAKVYAPYVLLRSLDQWRNCTEIRLPSQTRPILEATYCDSEVQEPETWTQLREELEQQREKMATQALGITRVWTIPALKDEEGVQTRYSSFPTAQLLLLNDMEQLDANSVRLQLLNGDITIAYDFDWDVNVAKAIHRNLVRIPHWVIAEQLNRPPRWLANYVHQPVTVGIIRTDGKISGMNNELLLPISYNADQGVIIDRTQIPRFEEDTDEYFD
jgi:CRISPR-associated endonuclease/helicase Cas3